MTKLYAQEKRVFDISKVTVVGSPTITSGGVVSGFSTNNYLTKSALNINPLNNWKVSLKIKTPSSQPETYRMVFCIGNENNTANRLYLRNTANNSKYFGIEFIGIKSGSLILQKNFNTNDGFAFDTWYDIEFGQSLNNGVYTTFMRYKPKGESIYQEILDTSATSFSNLSQLIKIGYWNQSTQQGAIGYSIDLTQLSIIVDNELVYTPTKPTYYFERRKPKVWNKGQFTVVGNPSITDDGVASGFSVGNYLTTPIIPFSTVQNYKICGIFTTPSEIPASNSIIYSNTSHYLYIHAGRDIINYISPSSGNLNIPYSVNTSYYYEIGYNGSQVFFNLTNLKTGVTESRAGGNANNKLTIDSASYLGILYNNTYAWRGSIDLKSLKIYTDNNLVFDGGAETYVYDPSKFTVVGSPTITEDGVLSKTSESTYLKISNNIVKQLEGKKSWRIDFKGVMPNDLAYQNITGQSAGVVGMLNIGSINGSGNFFVQIYAEDGTNKAIYVPKGVSDNYGKSFIGYASYDGSQSYTIALSVDNGVTWKTSSATWDKTVYFGENDLKVGYRLLTGSLDLTSFSITVDGKEVFTGAKEKFYAMQGGI